MSFEQFFDAIDRGWIGRFVSRKREIVERTNPDRIYVENVRSFFSVPYWVAHALCEAAVREGAFLRSYAVHCPTCDRIVLACGTRDEVPENLTCSTCELDETSGKGGFFLTSRALIQPIYSLRQLLRPEEPTHVG